MKKIISLLTLVLVSNLSFSQTTAIPQSQINEIYKGLKQNEYLKTRLKETEKALKTSESVVSGQDVTIDKQRQIIALNKDVVANLQTQKSLELEKKDIEINRVKEVLQATEKQHKKDLRKAKFNSFLKGGLTVGILGGATALFLLTQ